MYPFLVLLLSTTILNPAAASLDYQSDATLEERDAGSMGRVYSASFTWNDHCGASVACGPSMAGIKGMGTMAANNVTFAAGQPIEGGKGAGCGQCWHLEPMSDPYPQNKNKWGTPVVAMINDQCTDGGYCDQTDSRPTNTHYGKEKHFDLCVDTGTADQFFGSRAAFGVLLGVARQVPCSMLKSGPQGSGNGPVLGGSSSSDASKGSGGDSSSSQNPAEPSPVPVASPISPKPTKPAPQKPWLNSTLNHLPDSQGGLVIPTPSQEAPQKDVLAQKISPQEGASTDQPIATEADSGSEDDEEQDECEADEL